MFGWSTSYWPATISPRSSFGANEKRLPQFGQNPSTSPGCPSRLRPTGRSHAPQNRLLSATSGFASTAVAGSPAGTGGISTSPAPRCPRDARLLPRRPERLPARPLPLAMVPLSGPEPEPDVGPVAQAGPGGAGACSAGPGASPQVSQYPPSIVPPQPGRVHMAGACWLGTCWLGTCWLTTGARPQVSQYPPSIVPPQPGRAHVVAMVVIAVFSVRSAPELPADSGSPR